MKFSSTAIRPLMVNDVSSFEKVRRQNLANSSRRPSVCPSALSNWLVDSFYRVKSTIVSRFRPLALRPFFVPALVDNAYVGSTTGLPGRDLERISYDQPASSEY
jgi:hypothetical protein